MIRRQRANLDPRVKDIEHWGRWWERVVIIWEEDDATRGQDFERHGHEQAQHAFKRIFNLDVGVAGIIDKHDGGDIFYTLHSNGRVSGFSCEGGFVGVVAESALRVTRGGSLEGTLPCGHSVGALDMDGPARSKVYCAECWNA